MKVPQNSSKHLKTIFYLLAYGFGLYWKGIRSSVWLLIPCEGRLAICLGGGGKVILKILIGSRKSLSDNGVLPGESFR